MKPHFRKALIGLAVLAILIAFVWHRSSLKRAPKTKTVNTNTSPALVAQEPTNSLSAPATTTNAAELPPALLNELNRFVTSAKPYGLDGPIKQEEIIHAVPDRAGPKARITVATRTHTAEIDTRNHLRFFYARYDQSNPVAPPEEKREAMGKWYLATGKWSKEEALAETYRIMERLGIRFDVSRYELDAPEWPVKNPAGETVRVTPFYNVKLYTTNNSMAIDAEFRVGDSGPGRLTMWWENAPR